MNEGKVEKGGEEGTKKGDEWVEGQDAYIKNTFRATIAFIYTKRSLNYRNISVITCHTHASS